VRFFGEAIYESVVRPASDLVDRIFSTSLACFIGYLTVAVAMAAFIVVDSLDDTERLRSAGGILVILAFGFLCSAHPGHVRWRHVVWGLGLEFLLGLAVLRWDVRDVLMAYPLLFLLYRLGEMYSSASPTR